MSNITVTELQGHTSGGDANTVKVKSGHTLAAQSNATVGGTLGVTGTTTTAQINASGSINTTANTISVTNSSYPQLQLNSGVKNYHIFNDTGSNSLYFKNNTDAINGMIMDSSGRITQPAQPRFFAYMSGRFPSSGDIATDSIMVFDSTNQNVGNGFNTSNYRYTAPVAGTYVFGMNVRLVNNNGIRVARAMLRKNASQQWDLAFVGGSKSPNASDHPSLSGVTIINAAVNDYFDLQIQGELSYAGHLYADPGLRSNFWGYLLA